MQHPRLTLLKRIRMSAGPFATTVARGMLVERITNGASRWSLSLAQELPPAFVASQEVLFEAGEFRGTCHLRDIRRLEGTGELIRLS